MNHNKCKASTGIHEDYLDDGTSKHPWALTYGQGRLDDFGYWEIPCPDCARKAEIKDEVPNGSYWPWPSLAKTPLKIDPIIRQIVDRCHVDTRKIAVIRYVISRLKNKKATWNKMSRNDRRLLVKMALTVHQENRNLYSDVMSGKVN